VSRAFVKETDEDFERLPDRPISAHQNLVTPEGLERIEATLARLREERARARAANDRTAQASIERDLRYWASRHSTAQVVRSTKDPAVVHFGCTVTIARDGEHRQDSRIVDSRIVDSRIMDSRIVDYRIVGEDEADPSRGTLSHVSPLARALIGKQVGDVVRVGNSEAEVLEIKPLR
jgi:transcription elongation GreA/GreB family factor